MKKSGGFAQVPDISGSHTPTGFAQRRADGWRGVPSLPVTSRRATCLAVHPAPIQTAPPPPVSHSSIAVSLWAAPLCHSPLHTFPTL